MNFVIFVNLFILGVALAPITQAYKIVWDNDLEIDSNEIDDELTRSNEKRPNSFFIFPGTKWCGPGNKAANNSELGRKRDTDMCCRTHDLCPDVMKGHETKYNLENPKFFTRLECSCDKEFYKCLKSVNTKTSKRIGRVYFTVLGTKCFKNDYPIAGCNKHSTFPRKKCIEYIFNQGLPKKYQWFDLPNF